MRNEPNGNLVKMLVLKRWRRLYRFYGLFYRGAAMWPGQNEETKRSHVDPGTGLGPARSGAIRSTMESEPPVGVAQPAGCQGFPAVNGTVLTTTGTVRERAQDVAASPTATMSCEKMRDEANAHSQSAAGALVGWVQPNGCEARPTMGCTQPTRSRNVAATQDGSTSCEEIWNEANAEGEPEAREARPLSTRGEPEQTAGRNGADRPIDAGPRDSLAIDPRPMSGLALTSVRG